MITFKQFLGESRSAPLYHATTFKALRGIIKTGIMPKTIHPSKDLMITKSTKKFKGTPVHSGISTTRSLEYARDWVPNMHETDDYVILVLDQGKLTNNFKMIPVNALGGSTVFAIGRFGESEEFIATTKPVPLRYVSKIIYNAYDDDTLHSFSKILTEVKKANPHIAFVAEKSGYDLKI